MTALTSVALAALPTERFRAVLDDAAYEDLLELRERARRLLAGRALWCVSSTATGGGVAEMLRSLLAYTRGAGVDSRWVVLEAEGAFFDVTKRLHNWLHESPAAGGALDAAARRTYEAVTEAGGRRLAELVQPGDVVLLHDPQTLGMAPQLRGRGVHVIWRSHIGVDDPGARAAAAWAFLRPYLRDVDACVFSRERFVWDGLEGMPVAIVPPSIDVFSPKNQEMSPETVRGILCAAGIVEGRGGPAAFEREDGTPARVDRRATVVRERPLREDDRYVTQVSRWDRLKDPIGVLEGFVSHAGETADAHLLLVGPDVAGVSDDPEGQAVLAEVVEARRALPRPARSRVHLATLPMDDPEENAATVNAIQRHAAVVVQKSLAEGFGLTVTEAAWKARPIVASGVGGIQDQVVDRVTGLLVDPTDLAAFGHAVSRLLLDRALARRLGEAARERVRERFLEPRHLRQWVDLIERLATTSPAPASAAASAARPPGAADRRPAGG